MSHTIDGTKYTFRFLTLTYTRFGNVHQMYRELVSIVDVYLELPCDRTSNRKDGYFYLYIDILCNMKVK